jgi:Domain of unknown function (DUF4157)
VLTTTPAASDGLARNHGTPSSRPYPVSLTSASLDQRDGLFVQRKSNCACGGGCPSCQKSASPAVSQPDDASEIEAENIANKVMRMSDSSSSGSHLDRSIQSFMQSRLGADFSHVRIHTDGKAAKLSRLLNAQAFTIGNDIYFNEGRYQPESQTGKHLLAHELTHTIQQGRSHVAIQRAPLRDEMSMEDPIHGPLLDIFSAETGVPRDQASHHSPEYDAWLLERSNPTHVLNNERHTSSRYSRAVSAWPDDSPIWGILTTRAARINFVRFILSFDETNCVPLAGQTTPRANCRATASAATAFSNACQGYASQMYARYTSEGRLPEEDTEALASRAHVILGNVPAKFHIPIRIATVPGHAFNAVLIDSDRADVNSWLFFEPQNDEVFFASDPRMTSVADIYARSGIFTLSTLTGYGPGPQRTGPGFHQTDERSFLSTSAGTFTSQVLSLSRRMFLTGFFRDIFLADDPAAYPFYTDRHTPPQTYEDLIASYASRPSADLVMAFTFLNGKTFRRTPGGPTEVMTRATYLRLLNKPGLDALIPSP